METFLAIYIAGALTAAGILNELDDLDKDESTWGLAYRIVLVISLSWFAVGINIGQIWNKLHEKETDHDKNQRN